MSKNVQPKNYENAITELEAIIKEMEQGELSLEHSLQRYQRGTELLKFCQQQLSAAEQRISQLDGDTLTELRPDISGAAQ